MPPTLLAAVGLGLRAVLREPWLLAVGLAVGFARRAAVWPALIVGWAILARSVVVALSSPLAPGDPAEAVLAAATAPRIVALVGGLWLAGVIVGALLRVAWLAGALPTLGAAQAGATGPRFATGIAYGFPRVLAAAGLGLVLDVSGGLFGGTLAVAAFRISASASERGGSVLLAAAVALALILALAVPLALSVVTDAAVARAAVAGDGPAVAFAEGAARFLSRPGSFLLGGIASGLLAVMVPALVSGAGSVATGFASAVGPLVLLGPQLMLAVVAAAVAAGVDLVWLGTVTALACGEESQG